MDYSKQVAEQTITYLGGYGRLKSMVNAREFVYDKEGATTFTFSGWRKANRVQFILDADDTYSIIFFKWNQKKFDHDIKEEFHGLYFDQLKPIFEETTGLYLSL